MPIPYGEILSQVILSHMTSQVILPGSKVRGLVILPVPYSQQLVCMSVH